MTVFTLLLLMFGAELRAGMLYFAMACGTLLLITAMLTGYLPPLHL